MHKNGRTGFIIMEVLIAVAVVGMVIVPIFGLLNTLLTTMRRSSSGLDRLCYVSSIVRSARNEMNQNAKTFSLDQLLGQPSVRVHYVLEKPAQESSLVALDGVLIEKITTRWKDSGTERIDSFSYVVFHPESEALG